MEIKGKKYIITGGAGFLGSHLAEMLSKEYNIPSKNMFIPRSSKYDLRKEGCIKRMFKEFPADIVVHLATVSGGMKYYKEHPGEVFYNNMIMGVNLLEISKQKNIEKFMIIGTALAYPENAPVPYKEKDFWNGYPGEAEASHGMPNRILSAQAKAYKKDCGFNTACLILPNLYGPGDHFESEKAHVIPNLINKIYDAKIKRLDSVKMWGNGESSREFLYVKDAAKAIICGIENYDSPEPINVGPGTEVTIKDLASKIKKLIGFNGKIEWDQDNVGGIQKRALDSTRAEEILKFIPKMDFDRGLYETVSFFLKDKKQR